MPKNRLTRSVLSGAAAFLLVTAGLSVTGCATQPAVIVEASRDVRIVEISDEVAEKIAERVAAYIPKAPQTQRVAVRSARPCRPRGRLRGRTQHRSVRGWRAARHAPPVRRPSRRDPVRETAD